MTKLTTKHYMSELPEVIIGEPYYLSANYNGPDEGVDVTLYEHGDPINSLTFVVPYNTPEDNAIAALQDCKPLPDGTSLDKTIVELCADNRLGCEDVRIKDSEGNDYDLTKPCYTE